MTDFCVVPFHTEGVHDKTTLLIERFEGKCTAQKNKNKSRIYEEEIDPHSSGCQSVMHMYMGEQLITLFPCTQRTTQQMYFKMIFCHTHY